MKKDFYMMIPNDCMYVDGDDIYFVNRDANELYKGKISTGKYEFLTEIPKYNRGTYRANPLCVKYCENIICLPNAGECIWIYDMQKRDLRKIEVANPDSVQLSILYCWICGDILWAWSGGLMSLIEIDLRNERIKNYYRISQCFDEKFAVQVIKNGTNIYLLSRTRKILYEFNTLTKETTEYEIRELGEGINTVCFDGENFWFSGFDKCIYVWNKETRYLHGYSEFPKDFIVEGIGQMPLFCRSVILDRYICFIPWNMPQIKCNGILIVDRIDKQMRIIKIYEENDGNGPYKFEYVIGGERIVIWYEYNNYISEIDLDRFAVIKKKMKFSLEQYIKIFRQSSRQGMFQEKNENDLEVFIGL